MDIIKLFNSFIGVEDSYKAPEKLMETLYNKEERELMFMRFLREFSTDVSYDWFNLYFQEEHADRKNKKQDFTPKEVGKLCALLVGEKQGSLHYEACAGTGSMLIQAWECDRRKVSPFDYLPSDYLYTVEELDDRAIPFLIFNCAIRGMNAIIVHGDVITREAKGVFFVQNDKDDFMQFSSINVMPYTTDLEDFLRIRFGEFRYPQLIESKDFPKHLLLKKE